MPTKRRVDDDWVIEGVIEERCWWMKSDFLDEIWGENADADEARQKAVNVERSRFMMLLVVFELIWNLR